MSESSSKLQQHVYNKGKGELFIGVGWRKFSSFRVETFFPGKNAESFVIEL